MNILSLFGGIECGRIAADRAALAVDKYYSAEINPFCVKVVESNYPDVIHLGDVTKWREWEIDWASIDLLIGGSPCQGFSFAGKQLAFDDPRSALFFVYVDILNHIRTVNPDVKFMLENVKMKKEHMDVISEYLGVKPVFINSALVSAQNRARYYWCNWGVTPPDDKNINALSIFEGAMDAYKIKSIRSAGRDLAGKRILRALSEKSPSITARYYKGVKSDGAPFVYFGEKLKGEVFDYLENAHDYRMLTPIECERLQTIPDNYTGYVSNSQRYKMLGNAWTVDVIAHIFSQMLASHPTTTSQEAW